MFEKDHIIEENVDYVVEVHHHFVKIVINETSGKSGAVCDGCCAKKVTHPWDGKSFDVNKIVPSII